MVGPTRFELAINGSRPGRRSSRAAGGAVCEDTEEWTLEESYGGMARSQAVRVVEREGGRR
jgi:hypothetical protein